MNSASEPKERINERLAGIITPTGNDHLRALLGESDGAPDSMRELSWNVSRSRSSLSIARERRHACSTELHVPTRPKASVIPTMARVPLHTFAISG